MQMFFIGRRGEAPGHLGELSLGMSFTRERVTGEGNRETKKLQVNEKLKQERER